MFLYLRVRCYRLPGPFLLQVGFEPKSRMYLFGGLFRFPWVIDLRGTVLSSLNNVHHQSLNISNFCIFAVNIEAFISIALVIQCGRVEIIDGWFDFEATRSYVFHYFFSSWSIRSLHNDDLGYNERSRIWIFDEQRQRFLHELYALHTPFSF